MKTNELRIGNYVMYADVICKVEGYSKGFLETNGVNSLISKFQPITIDEKWLLNFGFIWNESWGCYMKNGYLVEKIGDLLLDRKYGKVMNHVHQLQNLYFSLTDKELQYEARKE